MVITEEYEYVPTTPWVTYILIGLNVIIFFMELLDPQIVYRYSLIPVFVLQGQALYTLVTHMFLHADFIHIFSNMYALWVFGDDCESVFGRKTFIIFYLVCGVFAGLFHSYFSVYVFGGGDIPCLGASGAIFGVIAAYAFLFPRRPLRIWAYYGVIRVKALTFALFYALVETLYAIFLGPYGGIAHTAHVGGFTTGVIMTFILKFTVLRGKEIPP